MTHSQGLIYRSKLSTDTESRQVYRSKLSNDTASVLDLPK